MRPCNRQITEEQCDSIVKLFDKYLDYKVEYDLCSGDVTSEEIRVAIVIKDCAEDDTVDSCEQVLKDDNPYKKYFKYCKDAPNANVENKNLYAKKDKVLECIQHLATDVIPTLNNPECKFVHMLAEGNDVLCADRDSGKCASKEEISEELETLDKVFDSEMQDLLNGKEANFGKAIGVGAAVGAGAGGLATAITALVEHSNISCRVGDGLAQVGLNKAHKIDTLKDFYVKWNLRLPDVIAPTKSVTNYKELEQVCKLYGQSECNDVQVSFKAGTTIETIHTICQFDTTRGQCLVNDTVAASHGLVPPTAAP